MSRDREPLPTREQIEAITDVPALRAMQDDVDARIKRIETDLEFGDGDDEWAGRARGALTAHRICLGHPHRHLGRLTKGDRVTAHDPVLLADKKVEKSLAAAERQKRHAEAVAAAAENKRAAASVKLATLLERTSYLARFHKAAIRLVDRETLERVLDAAERDTATLIKQEVEAA